MAEPDIEQVAVCVFIKAKDPRIERHVTQTTPEQVIEYLEKAELVCRADRARQFLQASRQVVPAV